MALSARLEMRQSQSLVMTPQLMQAIKLLQLSNMDLATYVEQELERNPLLERNDEGSDSTEAGEAPEVPDGGSVVAETAEWFESEGAPSPERVSNVLDTDLGNVYPDDSGTERANEHVGAMAGSDWASVGRGGGGEDYNLESFVAGEISLADHLLEQLAVSIVDPAKRLIGRDLIDQVDEAGYLRADLPAVAERLGTSLAAVQEVVAVLQTFEPTGVCALNLAECLALQLAEKNRLDPAMRTLLDHLDLLARRDLAHLRRLCDVDDEDLGDMIREIVALDPKPGLVFGSTQVQTVVPDVLVQAAADGGWLVELNSDTLPRVLVNQAYYAKVAASASDSEKAYLGDCFQSANWLTKSLDQRAKTILKVATEIVRQQDAFLAKGVAHLRPLNLRMIADAIGMHESTVSRVTSNKYMATSRGIFELKYFFTSSIASAEGGDAHSAEAVRHRIRQMIDAETAADVLSDDTIVKLLRDDGIDIARRTVAKYREAMRIPSSVQRRRLKLMGS